MDGSILYDLIAERTIYKWREEAEKSDDCNFKKEMNKQMNILCAEVGEDKRDTVIHFKLAVENYFDNIFYCINIKLINTCIKIGMEMQKFYDKSEE